MILGFGLPTAPQDILNVSSGFFEKRVRADTVSLVRLGGVTWGSVVVDIDTGQVRSLREYLRKGSLSQPGKVKRIDDDEVDLDLLLAEPVDALAREPARVGFLHVADPQRLLRRPVSSHLVVNLVADYGNLL